MTWRLFATCSVTTFALLSSSILLAVLLAPGVGPESPALVARAGIRIDGNGGFTSANGVVNGSGTQDDPYVIDGWIISDESIVIGNTSQSFVLSNLVVDSDHPDSQYGIFLHNVTNARIENCTIESALAGVLVGTYLGSPCSEIRLSNVTARSCQFGIVVHNSKDVSVTGCMITQSSRCAMYINRCVNFTASRNFATLYSYYSYGPKLSAFFAVNCSRTVMARNTITSYDGDGITLDNSTETALVTNVLHYCHLDAISLTNCKNGTITGSYFLGDSYNLARVSLQYSSGWLVTNNTFEFAFIWTTYSSALLISGNEFRNGGAVLASDFDGLAIEKNSVDGVPSDSLYESISLVRGSNATVSKNVLTRFGYVAIYAYSLQSIDISQNMVLANHYESAIQIQISSGVSFENNSVLHAASALSVNGCTNTLLRGNNFTDGGVSFSNCAGLRIVGNSFSNISELDIQFSSSEIIYGNAFLSPLVDVVVSGAGTWNSTYPVGGNFFSGHTWIDEFSGPNQNLSGADGISDHPFNISANNTDFYPLMTPPERTDTSPPLMALELEGERSMNGWFNSQVNVSIVAADLVSGLASIRYALDGSSYSEYAGRISITTQGRHTLDAYAVDLKGNTCPVKSAALNLDWTKPWLKSFSPSHNLTIYSTSLTISMDSIDNDSGILYWMVETGWTYAYVRGGSETQFLGVYGLSSGPLDLRLVIMDEAGNWIDEWPHYNVVLTVRNDDPLSGNGPYGYGVQIAIVIDFFAGLVALAAVAKHRRVTRYRPEVPRELYD